ncbi:DUF7504 family protein [Salinadaptatus halalkaliphilus]|uniref:DUF7504 family protein n=1 Tax=Salinadaptatus halalkaliphilus TaxID=2419781 RepID=UPI001FEA2026|nr:hypothetical protein [Salinadaptatus halalkaliphilus]
MWAESGAALRTGVQSHLLDHDRETLYKEGFKIGWNCPHCQASSLGHDVDEAVSQYERHLFEHVEDQIRSGVHVGNEIGGTGNVLVLSPPGTDGADDARIHFTAPADVALFVTTNVDDRLDTLATRLSEWPTRTIVLTTSERPLEGIESDLSDVSLEIVKLDSGLGLAGLGETISRVIDEHNDPGYKLSVGFEIVSEIVAKFDLERVFRFLHLLTSRIESADALGHYYWHPQQQTGPTLNLLGELFDLQLETTANRFVSTG